MTREDMEDFRQDMLRDQYEEEGNAKRDYQMQDDMLFAFEELNGRDTVNEFTQLLYEMNKLGHDIDAKELMELL